MTQIIDENKIKVVNIDCSNCGTELMRVQVMESDIEVGYVFVAHCDYCGDKSYEETFSGLLKTAGTDKSDLISMLPINGVCHWYTKKVDGIR